jgi:putative ABC transport system substrate-binding protein
MKTYKIGVLLQFAASDPEAQVRVRVFEQALQMNGWRKGQGVEIEYRFAAGNFNQMRKFAEELVELPVDVMVTNALSPIIAARLGNRSVPIVFAMVPNPVEQGLIKGLSRPDQNMTGFTSFEYSSTLGKWLELLKATAPHIARVGMLFNPDAYFTYLPPPPGSYWLRQLEAAASSLAIEPVPLPIRDLAEMHGALTALGRPRDGGLLVANDVFIVAHYRQVVAFALEQHLAGCYPYRYFAAEGGLMSYGPNGAHVFHQAASYVDRILRGANPGDLPIQRPTTLELVINLKTAKALDLTVPPLMLARADEVIE